MNDKEKLVEELEDRLSGLLNLPDNPFIILHDVKIYYLILKNDLKPPSIWVSGMLKELV